MNVAQPAVAVLSTGSVAFPLNRPVCALYTHTKTTSGSPGGKLAVLGSVHMFADKYIDKEDNDKVRDVLFRFFTTSDIQLNQIDADDPEVNTDEHSEMLCSPLYIYILLCLFCMQD